MAHRYISIWFRHLITDRHTIDEPALGQAAFVVTSLNRGRKIITAANPLAARQGIYTGMTLADARAMVPALAAADGIEGQEARLLQELATWCIRYSPVVAADPPDGLLLDVTGCAHLWQGEIPYLKHILASLKARGYQVRASMADTIGAAWANARYGKTKAIIAPSEQLQALLQLSPAALRLDAVIIAKLQKLGLCTIQSFIQLPAASLRRRFGPSIILRLQQALGTIEEPLEAVVAPVPYEERLPCLEPIVTATGIAIALECLLQRLCARLDKEGKGVREAVFKGYRMDGKTAEVRIGTNRASTDERHLFKLFEWHLGNIAPGPGIEVFVLEAPRVADSQCQQAAIWQDKSGIALTGLASLLDKVANKFGSQSIQRYLPDAHHWPERSFKAAGSMDEQPVIDWPGDHMRPVHLLPVPEPVQVAAPIPDYPPMHFRYRDQLHTIVRADGPERIEREWWLDSGQHRDYYVAEDEQGQRYWLFRLGHYADHTKPPQWFIHGFFA